MVSNLVVKGLGHRTPESTVSTKNPACMNQSTLYTEKYDPKYYIGGIVALSTLCNGNYGPKP